MRISDWSSDVCSSDLGKLEVRGIGIIERPWTAPVPLALAVRLTDRYDRMPAVNQVETVAGHPLPALLLSAFEASAPIKLMLALERLSPEAFPRPHRRSFCSSPALPAWAHRTS